MKAIINANVVLEDSILEDGVILVENDVIKQVGKKGQVSIPENCDILDAKGLFVGPGFVDIHCHAGGDVWAHEDPEKMARFQLSGGTTSLNCTIFHDIGEEVAIQAMRKIRKTIESNVPGNIVGVHFEGPFMNPKYGANKHTIRPVDKREYNRFLDEFSDLITMWTIAPEIEGAREFITDVHAAGIPLSIGHSEASPEDVFWAVDNGVSICTHILNATGCSISPTRWGGTKEVGFDDAVMLCDNVYCELINDSEGIHVRPEMGRLVVKTVGIDYVVAVTDACTGSVDDTDVNLVNGALYGSKLRMFQAARNFKNNTLLEMVDVFKVCSRNPARAIKIDEQVGTIELGKKANFVVVDDDYNISKVILDGKVEVEN
ncbi:MAG: amidohydrolase family protein [Clostridiales bacterium]|nr:amidohydrolase family protein [Clostridiales bacterium]